MPPFSAGAHVDVNLPNGTIRQYSIASSQADRTRYLLGVKLEENGRGGSRFLHEQVRVGSVLKIGLPRNNFPLNEDAASSVFIAGGIGITPILCMIDRLKTLGRDFSCTMRCACATEALLAQIDEADERISLHVDGEQDGRLLDIAAIVAAAPPDARTLLLWPSPDAGCVRGRVRQPPATARASRTLQRAGQCRGDRRRLHGRAREIEAQHQPCSRARRCCRRCRMRD